MIRSSHSKKCISPVVATALLLVVAVVAVVGFQSWFGTYSTNVLSGVESSSVNDVSSINIETVAGNSLYIKNSGSNLSIKDIKVGGYSCYDNDTVYNTGVFEIDISSCLENISISNPDVVVVTDKGLIEKKIYYKPRPKACSVGNLVLETGDSYTFYKYDKPYNNIAGCSAISQERTCSGGVLSGTNEYSYLSCNDSLAPTQGGEWVLVFANEDLGVNNDFYVMKYEAKFETTTGNTKDIDYNGWRYDISTGDRSIISAPLPESITYVSHIEAKNACESLGSGYKLINRSEWVAIARDVENIANNWNNLVVGEGFLYRGHSSNSPNRVIGVSNISDYYSDIVNAEGIEQRRVMFISSGEVVWDLAGNVMEWNNDKFNSNAESSFGKPSETWYEWTTVSESYDSFKPLNKSLTSANGIGMLYADPNNAYPSGTQHAFLSGGAFNSGSGAGIFNLQVDIAPEGSFYHIGFRCSYR